MSGAAKVTPGGYLARRRAAAGLQPADVDVMLGWEAGTMAQIEDQLRRQVEAVGEALFGAFPFDPVVLRRISTGDDVRICHACGCSNMDACVDEIHGACHWVKPNLCSDCQRQGVVA